MSSTYSVVYSPESIEDLRAILEYITNVLSAPQAAQQQVMRIQEAIRSLSTMPKRHPLLDWEPWTSMGIRRMNVGHYVVIYRIQENDFEVQVVRIAYGGRDMVELLANNN